MTLMLVYIVPIEDSWKEIILDSNFASYGCTKTLFYTQKLLLITKASFLNFGRSCNFFKWIYSLICKQRGMTDFN